MNDIIQFSIDLKDPFITSLGFARFFTSKDISIIPLHSPASITKLRSQPVDVIMNTYTSLKPDSLHSRSSHLTPALLTLARKKHAALGFAFKDVLPCRDAENQAILLGRMMQDVILCRAYKVTMVVCSFATQKWELRGARDLWSFAHLIGMTGTEATDALTFSQKQKPVRFTS